MKPTSCVVSLILALLAVPTVADAACGWKLLSGFGYGGAAFGSYFYVSGEGYPGFNTVAFGAGGIVGGWIVGSRACRKLARTEQLSSLHKNAVRAGTVFAGATAGAIAAGFITSGVGEVGADERILAQSIAIGAAGGALLQYLIEKGAPLHRMSIDASNGKSAVMLRMSF